MFDIKSILMEITDGEDGVKHITIHPEDLYPAIIIRIQEVLAGANPTELLATSERGGTARADILLANARALPERAWEDALCPREQFIAIPYLSVVEKNGKIRAELMEAFSKSLRPEIERMVARGNALEVALGWFLHALRLEYGGTINTITTGKGKAEGARTFRL